MRRRVLSRIALLTVVIFAPPSALHAQGSPAKQAEISKTVLKSMPLQKQRSKKSMMERAGLKQAAPSAAVSRGATKPAATSVRALDPKKVR